MASKDKQKKPNEEKHNDSDSSSDSSDDDNNDEKYNGNEVIQVEFEGRNPINGDFHGIRQLLHQLFLKSDINLSELSDIITDQNFIGSVVIQSFVDDDDSSDDDDDNPEFDSTRTIFGITTAVNISKSLASGCIDGLRKYLLAKCGQFAPPEQKELFQRVLNDDSNRVGFLINERFVNIPPEISVPLLENLNKEVNRAAVKKDKFKFTHYVMLVKFHRKDAKKSKDKTSEDIYSNGEEEILCEQCDASFEYSVQSEADSALSGNWLEGDSALIPHRKVVLFESHKLLPIIESIKSVINE